MDVAAVERLIAAIGQEDQGERLRELASHLLRDGLSRDELIAQFDSFREVLRREGREDEEDVVLDTMDYVVGWCSPHMRL